MNSGSILHHWNVHEYEIISKCRFNGTNEINGISEINEPNDTGSHNIQPVARFYVSDRPVVVVVSLPCLTPLVLSKRSAIFLISFPLPLTTSTSRQL